MTKSTSLFLKCLLAVSPLVLLAAILTVDTLLADTHFYGRRVDRETPPFQLRDVSGNDFENKHLKGRFSFIFFGFTRCTTICPRVMGRLSALAGVVDDPNVGFIFISIDPEHDEGEPLGRYQGLFSGAIKGISGNRRDVWSLARALGINVAADHTNQEEPFSHEGKVFLLGPDTRVRMIYGEQHDDVERVALDLRLLILEGLTNARNGFGSG